MTAALRSMKATFNPSGTILYNPVAAGPDAVVTGYATYITDAAAFAAALATLVADGASPTQAHVTAANSAYTTLAADWTALKAIIDAQQTAGANAIVVTIDTTAITNVSSLEKFFRDVVAYAKNFGIK